MENKPAQGATTPWVRFEIFRVPFFLEPDYPEDEAFSESNLTRLERKWGGSAEFQMQKRRHGLKERGQAVGIDHFVLDRTASNTLKSHCLVQWAMRTKGASTAEALYDKLNHLHFERGRKLNDREMLLDTAVSVGLDRSEAEACLADKALADNVKTAYQFVQRSGINSIPTFVIDGGRYVLNGAVNSSELVHVFRHLESEVADGKRSPNSTAPPIFAPIIAGGAPKTDDQYYF